MSTIRLTHNLGMTPKKTLIPSCLFREELNVFYPVDSSFGFCKKNLFVHEMFHQSLVSSSPSLFYFVRSFFFDIKEEQANEHNMDSTSFSHSLTLTLSLSLSNSISNSLSNSCKVELSPWRS